MRSCNRSRRTTEAPRCRPTQAGSRQASANSREARPIQIWRPSRQAAAFVLAAASEVSHWHRRAQLVGRSSQNYHAVLVLLFDGLAIQPVNHVSKPAGRAVDGFEALTRTITRLIRNGMLDELPGDRAANDIGFDCATIIRFDPRRRNLRQSEPIPKIKREFHLVDQARADKIIRCEPPNRAPLRRRLPVTVALALLEHPARRCRNTIHRNPMRVQHATLRCAARTGLLLKKYATWVRLSPTKRGRRFRWRAVARTSIGETMPAPLFLPGGLPCETAEQSFRDDHRRAVAMLHDVLQD